MSLVCLVSSHGSPGVTTTALALAATWPPDRRCLLVEADPFGGVIAARYRLADSPGLASLAAVARRGLDEVLVGRHTQQLPGGVRLLVGPASAEEAHAVLRDLAGALATWSASQSGVDVIVDCGRFAPGSATMGVMAEAGRVLVLARPTLDQLRPAGLRLAALRDAGIRPGLLLVGDRPYGPSEVAAALGVEVAGVIAWDPRTAAVLAGTRGALRALRRSRLVRSAATLAEGMVTLVDPGSGTPMDPPAAARVSSVSEEAGP